MIRHNLTKYKFFHTKRKLHARTSQSIVLGIFEWTVVSYSGPSRRFQETGQYSVLPRSSWPHVTTMKYCYYLICSTKTNDVKLQGLYKMTLSSYWTLKQKPSLAGKYSGSSVIILIEHDNIACDLHQTVFYDFDWTLEGHQQVWWKPAGERFACHCRAWQVWLRQSVDQSQFLGKWANWSTSL